MGQQIKQIYEQCNLRQFYYQIQHRNLIMDKAKILIVEDEAIIAMEIESCIQSLGYEVTSTVDTGEKAIKKAEVDNPDLILMDIRIKGDMDGIEAAEIIRNRFGIPVIFSTAYLDQERIERAKITMPFGYVLKPVQERDLRVTLEMALYVSKADAERKIIEEHLKRSETVLNATQQMKKIGGWEIDLQTQITYWTAEMYNIHGIKPDTFIDSDKENNESRNNLTSDEFKSLEESIILSSQCYDPENLQILMDAFKKCEEQGQEYDIESPFTSLNGDQKWVRTNAKAVKEGGVVVKIMGVLEDITERKYAEEKLKKSEEWFSTTLKSIGDAVITTDTKGNVTMLNPVAESLTGWKQKEVTGKPLNEIFNIINENTREQVENPVEKVLREGKIVGLANHTFLIAKDGKEIPIDDSASPIRDSSGEIIGVVLVFHDIIERKQAEAELKQNEKKYRTLFENSPYGVFLVDNNAKYIEVNDAACEMTGYSKEELLCLSIPEISAPDDETRSQDIKPFLDIQSTGKGEGIIHLKHKDGSIFKANLKGAKIDDNSVVGICEKLKD